MKPLPDPQAKKQKEDDAMTVFPSLPLGAQTAFTGFAWGAEEGAAASPAFLPVE